MATSQFNYYSSYDVGAPVLNGISGSLLDVLDGCLVTGYGTGSLFMSGSGWIKQFPNTGSVGCYRQPSGSGCTLFVNDNNFPQAGTNSEAWVCGYETLQNLTSSFGTGSGLFPGLLLSTAGAASCVSGTVVARKSATQNNIIRNWIMFADDRTFYLWTLHGSIANQYACSIWFGDIYSNTPNDNYKCMLHGHSQPGQAFTGGAFEDIAQGIQVFSNSTQGLSIQRTYSGRPGAVAASKMCDMSTQGIATTSTIGIGYLQRPNGADNMFHITPILINECGVTSLINNRVLRGRLRGLWAASHVETSWRDGQVIYGGGPLLGRSFRCVTPGPNSGNWFVETSNTVETN